MATKKAKKRKKNVAGETPITIGGGGGPLTALPLTIQYDQADWTHTPGLLTLIGGKVKRIKISAGDDVDVGLPVTGDVRIVLNCGKP